MPVRADWAGFRIADEFVVGYGLDYDGRYRQLKEIRVLNPVKG
jgi:hypoxanthine phosphoribosyltransferase